VLSNTKATPACSHLFLPGILGSAITNADEYKRLAEAIRSKTASPEEQETYETWRAALVEGSARD